MVTILPTSGPTMGGTIVRVRYDTEGASSDSTIYCRFGGLLSVGAIVSANEVEARNPTNASDPALRRSNTVFS